MKLYTFALVSVVAAFVACALTVDPSYTLAGCVQSDAGVIVAPPDYMGDRVDCPADGGMGGAK